MYIIVLTGSIGKSSTTEVVKSGFTSYHEASLVASALLKNQKKVVDETLSRYSVHSQLKVEIAICLTTPTSTGLSISVIETLIVTQPEETQ